MPDLAEELRARADTSLTRLLEARPDLASPAPSSVTALANRAGTRVSVERALAGLTRFELQVAEAVVALAGATARPGPVRTSDVAHGIGTDPGAAITRLRDLALLVGDVDRLVPLDPLAGAVGPYPCGLGPSLAVLDALHPGDRTDSPQSPDAVRAALADAPESARTVLDALTWGPPVGAVEADRPGPGATWLLARGVLRRLSPTQLTLPREVALAVRGGRLLRAVDPLPPAVEAPVRPDDLVSAESAAAADRVVRLVTGLLSAWDDMPPVLVRSGGLAVREARRVATRLGVDATEAAFVVELAAIAGLIGPWSGDDTPTWLPTADADRWRALDLPVRWAALVASWWESTRVPWLVGTRPDGGQARAALGEGLDRSWAPPLRRRLLGALADLPAGTAPPAEQVHRLLAWAAPRTTPPPETVADALREAARLGLLGAGALTASGRALLATEGADGVQPTEAAAAPRGEAALAAALAADLPEEVDDLLVQADLTGVVPGRPSAALDDLLEICADVESRGSAVTVRFTGASVRRALDAGLAAEDVLQRLLSHARTGIPQPLEYLVRDESRRHGVVRAGVAGSYLRSDDVAALGAVAADPRLRDLRLRALAPTVLVSAHPAGVVAAAVRDAGIGAVLEAPDGSVLAAGADRDRPRPAASRLAVRRGPARAGPGAGAAAAARGEGTRQGAEPSPRRLERIVEAMREGDSREAADGVRPGAAATPTHTLSALQRAAAHGGLVTLAVAGATGTVERRVVRPVSVDAGRVRVVDVARLAELTIAVHRIVDVAPAP